MFELDDPTIIARFCRTSTNPALVEFIDQHPPGSEFDYEAETFYVEGYRCYWGGVKKNRLIWDHDTLIVVVFTDNMHNRPERIRESSFNRDLFLSEENRK